MSAVKNILIVDDSRLTRIIIGKIIRGRFPDWQIIEAEDAEQAVTAAEQQQFDVITLDHNMPGMSGLDVYPQLKELQPKAKIGIFTANVQQSLKARAEAHGVAFIAKPISEEKLVAFMGE